jgi:protein phosphatase
MARGSESVKVFGLSDVGLSRENNEDTCLYELRDEGQRAIFVVCDGMGGAKAGNVASDIASGVFVAQLEKQIRPSMSMKYMESILRNAIEFANYDTYRAAHSSDAYSGMGTTLVGGFANGASVMLANVGDSRAYLWSAEGIERVTRDHSLVEELVQRGEITEDQAREHPRRNLITRALGTSRRVGADFYPLTIEPGQKLLLCSDGLSTMLRDEEISEILRGDDIRLCCERLINAANDAGGHDNITVFILTL